MARLWSVSDAHAATKDDADERKKPEVLLVEKDYLVANDLAFELEALDMVISGFANTLSSAMCGIEKKGLNFALLNVRLLDGVSYPVARRLLALGIPFAFFTSFEETEIDPEFQHIPRLFKPQDTRAAAEVVAQLAGRSVQPLKTANTCNG